MRVVYVSVTKRNAFYASDTGRIGQSEKTERGDYVGGVINERHERSHERNSLAIIAISIHGGSQKEKGRERNARRGGRRFDALARFGKCFHYSVALFYEAQGEAPRYYLPTATASSSASKGILHRLYLRRANTHDRARHGPDLVDA